MERGCGGEEGGNLGPYGSAFLSPAFSNSEPGAEHRCASRMRENAARSAPGIFARSGGQGRTAVSSKPGEISPAQPDHGTGGLRAVAVRLCGRRRPLAEQLPSGILPVGHTPAQMAPDYADAATAIRLARLGRGG